MSAPILEISALDGSSTKKFAIGKLPARLSFQVRARLLKMAGEPAFKLVVGFLAEAQEKAAEAKAADGDVVGFDLGDMIMGNVDKIGGLVGILGDRLDVNELDAIMEVVFSACKCNGSHFHQGMMFEAAFAGLPPGAVEKVFFAALKENFSNFFGAAG